MKDPALFSRRIEMLQFDPISADFFSAKVIWASQKIRQEASLMSRMKASFEVHSGQIKCFFEYISILF